jgi:hypothetical protein
MELNAIFPNDPDVSTSRSTTAMSFHASLFLSMDESGNGLMLGWAMVHQNFV